MSSFDPNKITYFARTDARGKNVKFGIKAKDRQRHMYIIGKTGMGKSTLLENMAVQDIQNGEGMAFIDPHGSAAETLLNYIPEHRVKDVLYFAPFDTDNPVSFNIMEDVGPDKRHLVVSGLMSVFKKIWIDAWSARMEYILSNTLLALLEYPDSTLLGVNRMLSDKEYRKLVVDNVKDPSVRSFWVDEFAKYNERYMQEAGDAIKNKIGQFTANPIIRNIVGQPKSSFDIRKMMDEKKILIMNLSKGLIGETNANLLGSMLTTRIYLAAMSRADLPPEKMREMPNFYFYVDEFQSFANATFSNILSEARKYHLNLTIAHQYIEQMEEEVRSAVFGNVGTIIAFRVGPFDAEVLETIFTPQFLAADIVNLGYTQIYLTLMIDGIGSQPFSATTLPPIAPPLSSCKDMAIAASRASFSKMRALVEEDIYRFHEPVVMPKKQMASPVFPDTLKSSTEKSSVKSVSVPHDEHKVATQVRHEKSIRTSNTHPQHVEHDTKKESFVERRKPAEKNTYTSARRVSGAEKHGEKQVVSVAADDLRAILRKIATSSNDNIAPVHNNGIKHTAVSPKTNTISAKDSLKEALHTVLATHDTHNTQNTQKEAIHTENVEVTKTMSSDESLPKKEISQDAVHVPKLNPKDLERMMRVTTNDKPPA